VPALFLKQDSPGVWLANFRIPPGLGAGWHDVRLRFADSAFGAPVRIAVDLPLEIESLTILSAVAVEAGHATLWVAGLAANSDVSNTKVLSGTARLQITYFGPPGRDGIRQLNVQLPAHASLSDGIRLEAASVVSNVRTLDNA
jgi:hypothetical protein